MAKVWFVIYVMIWLIDGIIGVLNAKTNKTNWFMIIFMLWFLTIPFAAKICKLF